LVGIKRKKKIVEEFHKHIESNKASFIDDELGLFYGSVRCFHAGE